MRLRTLPPLLLTIAVLASGCSFGPAPERDPDSSSTAATAVEPSAAPAKLTTTLPAGKNPTVKLTHRLTVRASDGELGDVTLRTRGGARVPGKIRGPQWVRTGSLLPATRYELSATAVNAGGQTTTRRRSFTTPAPALTDLPAVTPLAGSTVGVGHPVVVYFEHDVLDRAQVESRLSVDTSRKVRGSWGWIDDRTVAYRPVQFWPANTDVTVHVDLARTQLADGAWVMENRTIDFIVGRHQVLRIDDASHSMSVVRGKDVVRRVPVSMGKPGFTTRSGVKVIMSHERTRRMDSDTVGIGGSEAYDLEVPYALRLTATGEFIHGAPWSEWAQGSSNVSHGCTNVSLSDAAWLYANTLVGDPVVTVGTGRGTEPWNGLGGIWNFTPADWADRSAQ